VDCMFISLSKRRQVDRIDHSNRHRQIAISRNARLSHGIRALLRRRISSRSRQGAVLERTLVPHSSDHSIFAVTTTRRRFVAAVLAA